MSEQLKIILQVFGLPEHWHSEAEKQQGLLVSRRVLIHPEYFHAKSGLEKQNLQEKNQRVRNSGKTWILNE